MPPIKKNKKGRPPSLHKHLFSLSLSFSLLFSFFFFCGPILGCSWFFVVAGKWSPFFETHMYQIFLEKKKEETLCAAAPGSLHHQQQQQQNTRSPGAVGRAR